MAELPDYILVEQAQHGDSDAVALLYRRYVPAITRYIAYRVANNDAVEDLTAEVFLRMIEGLGHFQITGAPFEAWLYRIAAARIADYYRLQHRHPEEELTEVVVSGQLPLELNVQEREELDALRAALRQLSEEQQTILLLRFVERKSHEEVAQILEKSVRAIATAQHRALKSLAEILGTAKVSRHYLRGKST